MIEDLEKVIILAREAFHLCPQGHPDRSMPLSSFAVHLSIRYQELGATENLDGAMVLNPRGTSASPARTSSLINVFEQPRG